MSKNAPERMSGPSQIYLFNSFFNIDPSTMVIRHLKLCVSFVDKYRITDEASKVINIVWPIFLSLNIFLSNLFYSYNNLRIAVTKPILANTKNKDT